MKKSEEKINKSQLILAFVADNPEAKAKEVAEALTKQTGQEFTPGFVSTIKSNAKRAGTSGGSGGTTATAAAKRGPKPKTAGASAVMSNHHGSGAELIGLAGSFVKAAGGIDQAKAVLTALAEIGK